LIGLVATRSTQNCWLSLQRQSQSRWWALRARTRLKWQWELW